jgi:hypothetical protein
MAYNRSANHRGNWVQPSPNHSQPLRTSRQISRELNPTDRIALERAIGIVFRHPERGRQLAELITERGWLEAAQIAAIDCQARHLDLAPFERTPGEAELHDKDAAGCLLRRMLARGISRWDPSPCEAIAEAGGKRAA